MVKIICDSINDEIKNVAEFISRRQRETVKIITSTETLEVRYEKESEETQETQETQEKTFEVQEHEKEP